MEHQQPSTGLICSDASLLQRYVPIINSIKKYKLKALWCPNAEKSIHLATELGVPSVSHTAHQLLCKSDIKTVFVAGHPRHNMIYCMQAQALKKEAVCIGCLAVSVRSAQIIDEFTERFSFPLIKVLYPLRYSEPICLLRANAEQVGLLHTINVNFCFRAFKKERDRLLNDASTLLHVFGHELIDAVASICNCDPQIDATIRKCKTSVVQHFRLKELESAHMQIVFGDVVANFQLKCSDCENLSVCLRGANGSLLLDANELRMECGSKRSTLWLGNGLLESVFINGLINGLSSLALHEGTNEVSLVQCIKDDFC